MILAQTDGLLLWMWLAYTVVALAGSILVFVWAVRHGQFSSQDRARWLALDDAAQPRPTKDR